MNKNSNTYIIAYATILVVVVAAVLTYASISLSARQQANVLIEKKGAILASIGVHLPEDNAVVEAAGGKDAYVDAQYAKYITEGFFVDSLGTVVSSTSASSTGGGAVKVCTDAEVLDALGKLPEVFELKTAMPVFKARLLDGSSSTGAVATAGGTEGEVMYVVPLTGKGLWGPVWGYIALNSDCTTVQGAVFDHKGETPGLGAEIAYAPFHAQFVGKQLFKDGEFKSITLTKGVGSSTGNPFAVDAVSGGTLTSNGVRDMLWNCLHDYVPFFLKIQAAVAADSLAGGVADSLATDSLAVDSLIVNDNNKAIK